MNMNIRDYINEGGKVLATGKNHGFEEFFPLNYGENADPTQVCTSGDCRVLSDDVYQYWFGAFSRSRRRGLAPDGTANDVAGLAGAFDGFSFGLDGGDSADNPGATAAGLGTGTASLMLTDSILPSEDFPLIVESERLARWDTGGTGAPFEPVTGDWRSPPATTMWPTSDSPPRSTYRPVPPRQRSTSPRRTPSKPTGTTSSSKPTPWVQTTGRPCGRQRSHGHRHRPVLPERLG